MKRHFNSSSKEANMYKQRNPVKESAYDHYSRRPRSPSPYRQESSRRAHSGFTNHSSEDDYKSFRPALHVSLERDSYERNSACCPPDDEQFHSRSFLKERKETNSKSQEPESKSGGLHEFIPQLHALPTGVFLKLVLLKLDEMELGGLAELSELSKFISSAQEAFAKALPPEVEAVVKQMMFNNVGTNPPKTPRHHGYTQVSESRRESEDLSLETDFSLIRDILNKANRKDLSPPAASSNVASHQNALPYSGSTLGNVNSPYTNTYTPSSNEGYSYNTAAASNVASHQNVLPYPGSTLGNVNYPYTNTYTPSSNEGYSYNTASSSMTPGIPGLTLTEEQRESYSAYNAYQSQYSEPSSSSYHNFKF